MVDEGKPPTELWEDLAAAGYLGVNIPEEYGGGGLGMQALSWVAEEITAAGCSTLLIVVSPAIVGSILVRHGTPEQKDRWLRGIAAGTTKVAFAITEPDAGTNSHNLATTLQPRQRRLPPERPEDLHLGSRGRRRRPRRRPAAQRGRRRSACPSPVIVDVDAPGFTRTGSRCRTSAPTSSGSSSSRTSRSQEDRLDRRHDRRPGRDLRRPQPRADHGRRNGQRGRAARARKAADYARERKVWGAPIGTHQGVSHPLAEAKIELELARLMTGKAAALYDAGAKGAGEASNMAKYSAAEAAIKCVDQAIQTHGGNGFALEYGLTADVVGRSRRRGPRRSRAR